MKLILERNVLAQRHTLGSLRVLGTTFACDTIEPPYKLLRTRFDKLPQGTAIPYGNYTVQLTYSRKFRTRLPLVCDVPFFEGIRIHAGNSVHDTCGCVLVGRKDTIGHMVLSRQTLSDLLIILQNAKEEITLSVTYNANR